MYNILIAYIQQRAIDKHEYKLFRTILRGFGTGIMGFEEALFSFTLTYGDCEQVCRDVRYENFIGQWVSLVPIRRIWGHQHLKDELIY